MTETTYLSVEEVLANSTLTIGFDKDSVQLGVDSSTIPVGEECYECGETDKRVLDTINDKVLCQNHRKIERLERDDSITKSCRQCGIEFTVKKWFSNAVYCTTDCYYNSRRKLDAYIERECKGCKITFTTHKTNVEKGYGIYCSKDCLMKYKHNKEEI